MTCDSNMPDKHMCSVPDGCHPPGSSNQTGSSKQSVWTLYLIYSPSRKRSYLGITTSVTRRLRQHRGEITGGARATTRIANDWELVATVTGFTTKSSACRWERIIKCRARGVDVRLAFLLQLSLGACPGRGRYYEPPKGLEFSRV